MRVLVACESSGLVREAFRARGHEAWSCDTSPSEDDSLYHIQDDVLNWLDGGRVFHDRAEPWDLMIGHPPCTYLCNSGVHHLSINHDRYIKRSPTERDAYIDKVNERWMHLDKAREFFLTLYDAPIPKIVLENPVPHKYGVLPKYTQTIQPYMFGDDASKRTCLWLKGLEKLHIPSEDTWAKPRIVDGKKRWSNQTDGGQNKLPPSLHRATDRSRTYQGIADALAEQYG